MPLSLPPTPSVAERNDVLGQDEKKGGSQQVDPVGNGRTAV